MRECKIDGCCGDVVSLGMCNRHYLQVRRGGRVTDGQIVALPGEKWLAINGLGGLYFVSNCGRVKSIMCGREKILKLYFARRDNCFVVKCGSKKRIVVHSAVAGLFLPNPHNDTKIIFKDGDHKNIHVDNLCWGMSAKRERNIAMLKKQALGGCGDAQCCLKYMDGDNQALNVVLETLRPAMVRLVRYLYSFYVDVYGIPVVVDLDGVVQDALCKLTDAVRRGLVFDAQGLGRLSKKILRNTLINSGRAERVTVSQNGVDGNGEGYDYIDYVINNGMVI